MDRGLSQKITRFSLMAACLFATAFASAQTMPEPNAPISALRKRAALIYQRLAGVKLPIDAQQLKDMEAKLAAGDEMGAAAIATSDPAFLNITVKHFAARMSTRDETPTAPLSDFVATVMGAVRDNKNAKTLLSGDYFYMGDPARVPASVGTDLVNDVIRSNNHYEDLDALGGDTASLLIERPNELTLDRNGAVVNLPDAGGLITSRAFTEAHAVAGTNRRMNHFAFRQFLCIDIAQWADTSLPDVYVGRDVDRAPGGDPTTYMTTCKGCHSPQDALRDAYAHIDFPDNINNPFLKHGLLLPRGNGQFQFRATTQDPTIAEKYSRGADTYPAGHHTVDARWVNNLRYGSNAKYFGWRNLRPDGSGVGVKEMATMIADAEAFSRCMVRRVYRSTCKREVSEYEVDFVAKTAVDFEKDYSLRRLFQTVATSSQCIGQ